MKTLEQRINETFLTKKGTIKVNCQAAYNLIRNPNSIVRPVCTTGSGRYIHYSDISLDVKLSLINVGVEFETGNDAPRGGKTGNYIRLTEKGKKQVAAYNRLLIKRSEVLRVKIETEEQLQKEAKKTEIDAILAGVDTAEVLKGFFQNETHPAPPVVVSAKIQSGLSWNALRKIYK